MVVAVLGIISAAVGFAAEVTRVKRHDVRIVEYSCVYPSSPAVALGFISAGFAIITQVVISFTIGACCSCCKNDPNSTPISKLMSVFSRVATVIGVVLLLAASRLNTSAGGEVDTYNYTKCYVVKPGIFATGATLALLSVVFGIAAYVTVSPPSSKATTDPPAIANNDPEDNIHVPNPPQNYAPNE
ncbi:hypothetical protein SSX86_004989 [Deinandra increscens subsp. villosa]|uniref:Uncharacterized protein n=1 Tax=Deinandra increscens subsp. villosa TaxID=3103831 RepID=A0AAP0DP07_9ASTR